MRKLLWGFAVALTASIVILACQKEDSKETTSKDFSVAAAKEWWYGEFRKSAAYSTVDYKSVFAPSQNDGIKASKKYPSWKDGISYKAGVLQFVELPLVYNNQVALFPGSEVLTRNEKIRIASASLNKLLLIKKPDNSTVIRTVSLIPSPEYASAKGYDISNTTLQKPDPQFSGWLVVKDWKETLLKYWQIQNGRVVKKMLLKEKNTLNQNNQFIEIEVCNFVLVEKITRICVGNPTGGDQPPNTNPEDCTEWIENTYFEYEWVCEEVIGDDPPDGECGMGISAEQCACILYNIGCEDGGGGGGDEPPQIENNVNDPCIHDMVENALDADCSNKITSFINTVFGNNDKFNLEYIDGAITSGPNFGADAYTTTQLYSVQIGSITYQTVTKFNTLEITAATTREYIAATILHEAIHAWINYTFPLVQDNAYQHNLMVSTWRFSLMANALQEMFPSMPAQDVIDLTWGGNETTPAYQALPDSVKTRITQTNNAYKNRVSGGPGTPCQ